jgi:hypothetical protein
MRRWYLFGTLLVLAAALLPVSAGEVKETKSALEADPSGWMDLLAAKNLTEWKRVPIPPGSKLNEKNPWVLNDVLLCKGKGAGHEMLLYNKEFGDGIFHVEWRFTRVEGGKKYNSGVYVRNSADGEIWHQAQVGSKNVGYLFGDTLVDGKLKRFNVRNKEVPQRGKEAGEWNTYEITCRGKTMTLWINGAVTAEWKECEAPRGYVGLEAEGWDIEFKNVKFKELK